MILSISSDIGTALAEDWIASGFEVVGTYRTWSENCERLKSLKANLIQCDFTNKNSVKSALSASNRIPHWDVLVLGAGDQNPIGLFKDIDFDNWEKSIDANFTGMLRFLHKSLGFPSNNRLRSVVFFAGGGTNSATERYSAYTISKIASMKMCELLDFEIKDTKFTILGPGWVKTKIHYSTLIEPENSGRNFEITKKMLSGMKVNGNQINPMSRVIECCNWVISQSKEVVGGRNFSVIHDQWENTKLVDELVKNNDLYKLRRFGNDLKIINDVDRS
jgi:NADP-dependent 3-hydroxy acid dehydrogenase YdfG